jgi:hypothetical protein
MRATANLLLAKSLAVTTSAPVLIWRCLCNLPQPSARVPLHSASSGFSHHIGCIAAIPLAMTCHRHAHRTLSGPLTSPRQPLAPSPTIHRTIVRTLARSHTPRRAPSRLASLEHSLSFPNAHASHITDITPDTALRCPLLRTHFPLTTIDTDLSSPHMLTPTSCTTCS